jgi:hypothetical protein
MATVGQQSSWSSEREESAPRPAGERVFGFSGIRPAGDLSAGLTARLTTGIRGNATRTVIHWQALEPKRDVYRPGAFDPYERLYRGLLAGGVKPIFVIQYAPEWARDAGAPRACGGSDSCHFPPARSMLPEWREFVVAVARHFPQAGIEVWNEPNYLGQWRPEVQPARYAQLVAAADAAAASVDPRIPVYLGGLGTVSKARSMSPAEFLRRAYAAKPSLKGHVDALNLHVFPPKGGQRAFFRRTFAPVRAVRAAAGDGRTPILVGELGRTTTGPLALTESEQANVLVRAARRVLKMPDTLGALLYTLADRDELPPNAHERGFGVVKAGPGRHAVTYRPKPAYCALRVAAGFARERCRPGKATPLPRLRARVRPRRVKVRAGGKSRRFLVRVKAPPIAADVRRVKVCIVAPHRKLRIESARCRRLGTLRTGRAVRAKFRIGLKPRAARKRRPRFVATAKLARKDGTRATIRPR